MANQIAKMPQAVDLEQVVLGAMLIDNKALHKGLEIIKNEDVFYSPAHVVVFRAINSLFSNNSPVDLVTVGAKLKASGDLLTAGSEIGLIEITQKVASGAHIEAHTHILLQKWIARKLIMQCSGLISKAYSETTDILDLLSGASETINNLNESIFSRKKQTTFPEALQQVKETVERLTNMDHDALTGANTGFKKLNELTGGYQPSDLIIIAARPGMGKTSLLARTVLENGKVGDAVGMISLEMSTKQLTTRLIANNSSFHLTQLFRKGFEKKEYFETFSRIQAEMEKYPLYFNDTPSMELRDVLSQIRVWHRKHNIKIVLIDYLQLIKNSDKKHNREQEIASITMGLKAIAKELSIPVVALSQLSRQVEQRPDKRPRLSDLRESGAIEQDADLIAFIYRPEYYSIEPDEEMLEMGANTEFDIAKHRNGSLSTIGLYFIEDKTKFVDPESRFDNNPLPPIDPKTDNPF